MKIVAFVIAILATLAAACAAVGTFGGASPAVFSAIGAAVVALVAIAIFRSRPMLAAAFATLAVGAAFALGAVLLGGSDMPGGVTFYGLHPGDSASLVVAVAIALAALGALVVARNLALRLVVVLVAIYALVPTIASIGNGGLTGALGAAPFAWMRGTFVACEALLPLAAVCGLLWSFVHVARERSGASFAALVSVCAFAGAMLCAANLGAYAAASLGLPSFAAFERPAGAALRTVAGEGGTAAASATAMAVTASATAVPATSIAGGPVAIAPAVAAEAQTLGADPPAALGYVARVRDELYDGVLRGADGTLRSGGGDAADKALLLHDLIAARNPGAQLRYATCELSDAQSEAFATAALAEPAVAQKTLFAAAGDLANAAHDPASKATLTHVAQVWQNFAGLTSSEADVLSGEASVGGLPLPGPAADDGHAVLAHHVWLQMQSGSGWLDLDPTIAPGTMGKTRCPAAATPAALPDDRYATVQIRVVVDERIAGVSQRRTLLASSFRVADAASVPVALMFAESAGLRDKLPSVAAPPPSLRRFTPLLQIGDRYVAGDGFLLPLPAKGGSNGQAAAGAAAAALAAFGTAAPATPEPAATAPSDVTGAWIDLTLATPDAPPETYESEIFDRLGFAARGAGPSASPAAPLADVGTAYLPLATMWTVGVTSGAFTAGAGDGSDAPQTGSDVARAVRGVAALHGAFARVRHALFASAPAAAGYVVVEPRPALSLLAISLQSAGGGLAQEPRLWLDAATDHARLVAKPGAAPAAGHAGSPAAAWAVASLLAERFVVNAGTLIGRTSADPATASRTGDDVINVFALAREQHDAPTVVADATQLGALDATPNTKARIAAALEGGGEAIAPAHEVSAAPDYGWWLVDPASGLVRDETRNGRHQDEVAGEALIDEEIAVEEAPAAKRVGLLARCAPFIASMVLALGGDLSGAADVASTYAQDLQKIQEIEEKMNGAELGKDACTK